MDVKIKKFNNTGQIAVFVILAVMIIIVIFLIFFLRRPPTVETPDEKDPQSFLDSCTVEATEKAIEILGPQGGYINPVNSITFEGMEREYLCYTSKNYAPCVNKGPMLIEHIEDEIYDYVYEEVRECFDTLTKKYEERYDITQRDLKLTITLKPKQVTTKIDKYFKMERGDKIYEFDEFEFNQISSIYNLAEIAMEIVNQESQFCNFDYLGYMILYPEYEITKIELGKESDLSTIYKIKHRDSGQEFVFAVRSCAIPPPVA